MEPRKVVFQEGAAEQERASTLLVVRSPRKGSASGPALSKQRSQKASCLCSPTTHAGSFRCRLHRSSLRPSGSSVGSRLSELADKVSRSSAGSRLSELADKVKRQGAHEDAKKCD